MTDMVFQKNLSVKLLQRRFFRPAKLHIVRALHASCLSVFVPYMLYLPGTFTYPPVLITLHSFVHSRPFLFCVFLRALVSLRALLPYVLFFLFCFQRIVCLNCLHIFYRNKKVLF